MHWAIDNPTTVRTIVAGCVVAAVACSLAIARPKSLSFPSISFAFGAAAVTSPSITLTHADAVQAITGISSIDDVHSQADLVAYADGLMQNDPRISQIVIMDRSVSMTYQTSNSVLNIHNVHDTTRATVFGDGTVTISGSWYRPLFTHTAHSSSQNAGFSDIVAPQGSTAFSPSIEARLLARLHGRFQIGAIK